jgi:hypothetical protein
VIFLNRQQLQESNILKNSLKKDLEFQFVHGENEDNSDEEDEQFNINKIIKKKKINMQYDDDDENRADMSYEVNIL